MPNKDGKMTMTMTEHQKGITLRGEKSTFDCEAMHLHLPAINAKKKVDQCT